MSSSAPESRRSRRIAGRRGRHVRRLRSLATATAMLAASTLVGVAAAGGTYALLNDKATMNGATIKSGTLQLQIQGSGSYNFGNFSVTPNTPVAKSFTLTNVGDVNVSLSAASTTTSGSQLVPNARIRITPVTSTAACVPGLPGQQGPVASYTNTNVGNLAKGTSSIYCLELSLDQGTSANFSGQSFPFTVTISGAQRAA